MRKSEGRWVMPERRPRPDLLSGDALDYTLRAAGLRLGRGPESIDPPPALEHVIVSAAAAAFPRDYRLLSVVTTWLGVHAARVHVGELARLLPCAEQNCADPVRFRAYWAGIAHWLRKDNRWSKVARMYPGPPVYLSRLDRAVVKAAIEHKGEDPRFTGSRLRVPVGMLRDRPADVASPEAMAANHPWYHERLRQGPTYRADCWAELERDPAMTAAALARRVGCTYPVAHRAVRDRSIVMSPSAA